MILRFLLAAAVLALALPASPLTAQGRSDDALPGFMAGAWMMEDGATWNDEVWTDPRGGVMLGMARTGFGPQLQQWEMARIERKSDGSISLFAQPMGRAATEFRQVLRSAESVEFANPANDYPQRIRYWRQGQLLMAEISRLDGSDAMRWNYRPVKAIVE